MEPVRNKEADSTTEIFKSQQATIKVLRTQSYKTRITGILRIKKWVEANKEEIREALYLDFKKPAAEVDLTEIYAVLAEINHALTHLKQWVKPGKVDTPLPLIGSNAWVQNEPKGVCLIISPWNFPFTLTVGPLVSALSAGNTAILKPSELSPNSSKLMARMVAELFDPSEVAIFLGGKKVAESLLKLPFDHIFFTGSPKVGKLVMEKAAQNLSSVTLELGGKSPAIVEGSADLADAAEKIVWGKFLNCGQTCIAPDYVLVEESVRETFLEHLCRFTDRFFDPTGDGIEQSNSYARIVGTKHFQRLTSLLTDALNGGSEIECGGKVKESENFIAPTILSAVPHSAKVMQEEIFGPILPVLTFRDISEVIKAVNDKSKPLALYIFSNRSEFRNRILQETSSGSVAVNDCIIQFMNPHLPFGGVNHSGIGKSHGKAGFLAFSNQKSVLKQKKGLTSVKPLFPPYTELTKKAIKFLIKYL